MAAEEKWDISIEGRAEVWVRHAGKFVARFKYANANKSAKHFVAFLKEQFTPAEYFARMAENNSPLTILQAKGYVSYNALRAGRVA